MKFDHKLTSAAGIFASLFLVVSAKEAKRTGETTKSMWMNSEGNGIKSGFDNDIKAKITETLKEMDESFKEYRENYKKELEEVKKSKADYLESVKSAYSEKDDEIANMEENQKSIAEILKKTSKTVSADDQVAIRENLDKLLENASAFVTKQTQLKDGWFDNKLHELEAKTDIFLNKFEKTEYDGLTSGAKARKETIKEAVDAYCKLQRDNKSNLRGDAENWKNKGEHNSAMSYCEEYINKANSAKNDFMNKHSAYLKKINDFKSKIGKDLKLKAEIKKVKSNLSGSKTTKLIEELNGRVDLLKTMNVLNAPLAISDIEFWKKTCEGLKSIESDYVKNASVIYEGFGLSSSSTAPAAAASSAKPTTAKTGEITKTWFGYARWKVGLGIAVVVALIAIPVLYALLSKSSAN